MSIIWIEVPGTPPSVNHYVKHSRGRHFKTAEATRFLRDIAYIANGRQIRAKEYTVDILIYLAPKQRLDIDNAPKLCLDGLVKAGVIHSDAAIKILRVMLERAKTPQESFTRIGVDEL